MDELESNDDEMFSMDDLEKDLKKSRGARRLPWFGAGLILGIAGTIFIPGLVAPYVPGLFGGEREILSGPVLAKERDGDRLLLTIDTEPGALIASFSERVAEIDLLVDRGDTVTIAVDDYDPFIEDPDFEGVRKATAEPQAATDPAGASDPSEVTDPTGVVDESGTEGAEEEGEPPPADTAGAAPPPANG